MLEGANEVLGPENLIFFFMAKIFFSYDIYCLIHIKVDEEIGQ